MMVLVNLENVCNVELDIDNKVDGVMVFMTDLLVNTILLTDLIPKSVSTKILLT